VTPIIQIENLHYRPPSTSVNEPEILCGIDLNVESGTFVAIVGENGSGKTTLLKHLNGLLTPSEGSIVIDGLDTRRNEHRVRLQSRVGMVFQNPAEQIVASTVAEDVAFGLENLNLPSNEIQNRVTEQLTAAGILSEANRPPHLLSGGQIQRAALAGVLARDPRIILLDEPTSMLDSNARSSFLQHLYQLKQDGKTIIYITHHMEETLAADLVVIMKSGQVVISGSPQKVFNEKINLYEYGLEKPELIYLAEGFRSFGWQIPDLVLGPGTLSEAIPVYAKHHLVSTRYTHKNKLENAQTIIDVKELQFTYLPDSAFAKKALKNVDLVVTTGSIHGIAGSNGSGKSTLLQHINGIFRPESGSARVGRFSLEDSQTRLRDIIQFVGLVFQNPEDQFFEVFVGDEIAYGPKQFLMDDVRDRVRESMHLVGLDFKLFKDRRIETLSGGEKRKVALASTLVLNQNILLFDEPTAGMDPKARNEILNLFKTLQNEGKTIVFASHKLEEMANIATHLSLMHAGMVTKTGQFNHVVTDINAIKNSLLKPPLAVSLALALIEKGWPIDINNSYTASRLLSSIKDCLNA